MMVPVGNVIAYTTSVRSLAVSFEAKTIWAGLAATPQVAPRSSSKFSLKKKCPTSRLKSTATSTMAAPKARKSGPVCATVSMNFGPEVMPT